jgi:hypothetical protein
MVFAIPLGEGKVQKTKEGGLLFLSWSAVSQVPLQIEGVLEILRVRHCGSELS